MGIKIHASVPVVEFDGKLREVGEDIPDLVVISHWNYNSSGSSALVNIRVWPKGRTEALPEIAVRAADLIAAIERCRGLP